MYRATATALALISFLPRVGVGVGFEPMNPCGPAPCGPQPCGCELPPVDCCEPLAPTTKAARPKRPAPLPTPANTVPAKPAPLPSPQPEAPTPTPAPNADAISPLPLNTPAIAETPVAPVEVAPAPAEVPPPSESAPIESAPRYSEPPAAEPATPAPAEPATPAPAADEDALFPAPAEETTEETTPAPVEEPSTTTPDYDDLFPPSSANEVLTHPGGWASDAPRPWNDADGQLLFTGRIAEVTARFVVLLREDGHSQAVRYAHLADEDLSFLRQQIEARRTQLAAHTTGDALLATQAR